MLYSTTTQHALRALIHLALIDGAGPVLVLIEPATNPDHTLGVNWRASSASGGSPGVSDALDYAAWAATNGVADLVGSADDDGDGLANLLEYFFGSSPTQFTAQPVSAVQTISVNGVPGEYLTITFTTTLGRDEVVFSVEASTDLAQAWVPAVQVGEPLYNALGTETYTFRHPQATASGAQQFLRVKVTR